MSDTTTIAWTDRTWNPTLGCSRVSPGCMNCYAESIANRFRDMPEGHALRRLTNERGEWNGTVRLMMARLRQPLGWRAPARVFVDSMSDLFHAEVPDSFLLEVFQVMQDCHDRAKGHTFQVLTKRPQRMAEFTARLRGKRDKKGLVLTLDGPGDAVTVPGVWLGTSVENQDVAEERIPWLAATRAEVRFLSCEPLLGPLDLRDLLVMEYGGVAGNGEPYDATQRVVDWLIAGGESGRGARPADMDWFRDLQTQCRGEGVAFFFKQTGSVLAKRLGYKDSKGENPSEWPADLIERDWPVHMDEPPTRRDVGVQMPLEGWS